MNADNVAADAGQWRRAAPVLIAVVGLAAYAGSFRGAFIFDDITALKSMAGQMRSLWLWPDFGQRWIVDWSLQVNFALGAKSPWGYHAVNLAIHILAGFALYGVVRRTLLLPRLAARFGAAVDGIGLAVALLWLVHPIQTESVTYVIQRAESLMGLLYLLTLYAAIRSFASPRPLPWQALSVAACALGMAAKPVMVTAPVMVGVYDWLFVSGSLRAMQRRSPALYAGLATSWFVLIAGMIASPLGPTAGLEMESVTPAAYLATQPASILRYLRLVVWPGPLVFDYYGFDFPPVRSAGEIALPALVVGGLLAATLWGLWRRREWSFLGVWFFAILSPTSSVVPVADPYFEHRMYLPLAAAVTGVVLLAYGAVRKWSVRPAAALAVAAAGVAVLAGQTWARNQDYANAERMWRGVLAQRPENTRAEVCLGEALIEAGHREEGLAHIRKPLAMRPGDAKTYRVVALALERVGEWPEAEAQHRAALAIDPRRVDTRCDLADLLHDRERYAEAIPEYAECLRRDEGLARAWHGMADSLARLGRLADAAPFYQEYLRRRPKDAEARNGLGVAWLGLGRLAEAREEFRKAVLIAPLFAEARMNLGIVLMKSGDAQAGDMEIRRALEIKPELSEALRSPGQPDASAR